MYFQSAGRRIKHRFVDTDVDGSNHQLWQFVVSLSKALSALLQSTQQTNVYQREHPHEGYLFNAMSCPEKKALKIKAFFILQPLSE